MVNHSDDLGNGFDNLELDWFAQGEQISSSIDTMHSGMMAPLAVSAATSLRATLASAPEKLNDTVLELMAKIPGLLEASSSAYDGLAPSDGGTQAALPSVVDTNYFASSMIQQSLGNGIKFAADAVCSDNKDWTTGAEVGLTVGGLSTVAVGVAAFAHMSDSEYHRYLILWNLAVQIASYVCTRFGIDDFWKRHAAGVILDTLLIQGPSAYKKFL